MRRSDKFILFEVLMALCFGWLFAMCVSYFISSIINQQALVVQGREIQADIATINKYIAGKLPQEKSDNYVGEKTSSERSERPMLMLQKDFFSIYGDQNLSNEKIDEVWGVQLTNLKQNKEQNLKAINMEANASYTRIGRSGLWALIVGIILKKIVSDIMDNYLYPYLNRCFLYLNRWLG